MVLVLPWRRTWTTSICEFLVCSPLFWISINKDKPGLKWVWYANLKLACRSWSIVKILIASCGRAKNLHWQSLPFILELSFNFVLLISFPSYFVWGKLNKLNNARVFSNSTKLESKSIKFKKAMSLNLPCYGWYFHECRRFGWLLKPCVRIKQQLLWL